MIGIMTNKWLYQKQKHKNTFPPPSKLTYSKQYTLEFTLPLLIKIWFGVSYYLLILLICEEDDRILHAVTVTPVFFNGVPYVEGHNLFHDR